jgi:hypothetical protein
MVISTFNKASIKSYLEKNGFAGITELDVRTARGYAIATGKSAGYSSFCLTLKAVDGKPQLVRGHDEGDWFRVGMLREAGLLP